MDIIENIKDMQCISNEIKTKNKTIGFVPTMGALHKGHISLIQESLRTCDITIVSIFVNPLQFGPNEDFEKYPRNRKKDIDILENLNIDYLFYPDAKIMCDNILTKINVGKLSDVLCGAKRKGHFEGVCVIVAKLFNIIMPNKAFFGEKDYQQYLIIKKMTDDLNYNIDIIPCKIIREKDGLAMSSRNKYLNKYDRKNAALINVYMKQAVEKINKYTDIERAKDLLIKKLSSIPNSRIDYVEILNEKNLEKPTINDKYIRLFVAIYIGETRLIDNMEVIL